MGYIILGYAAVMGILLVVSAVSFKSYGGSLASAATRRKMGEWGSDIENRRLKNLGIKAQDER